MFSSDIDKIIGTVAVASVVAFFALYLSGKYPYFNKLVYPHLYKNKNR